MTVSGQQCPVTLGGQRCDLVAGHPGNHQPPPNWPATVVRTYYGNQSQAAAQMQADAAQFTRLGYQVVSQQWSPGQWGAGAFLIALALCIILVGILIFVYMLIVKPAGTLTVTFAKAQPTVVASATPADPGLSARLRQLDEAKAAGLISEEEWAAGRASAIGRV